MVPLPLQHHPDPTHPARPALPSQNLDLPAKQAVSVECSGIGKYVTLATPKNLTICDIYIQVAHPAGTRLSCWVSRPLRVTVPTHPLHRRRCLQAAVLECLAIDALRFARATLLQGYETGAVPSPSPSPAAASPVPTTEGAV